MVIATGFHLFPFRTEKLSPTAPMVLHTRGRVGRRHFTKALSSQWTRGFFCVYIPAVVYEFARAVVALAGRFWGSYLRAVLLLVDKNYFLLLVIRRKVLTLQTATLRGAGIEPLWFSQSHHLRYDFYVGIWEHCVKCLSSNEWIVLYCAEIIPKDLIQIILA